MPLAPFQSQITFLSYDDLDHPAEFYGGLLGLEMVFDQEMARIYRAADHAFIGIVNGTQGYHQVRVENSVVISLTVENVDGWYDHLLNSGVKILSELREQERAPVRSFYFEDPGGYTLEIQEFTQPEDREIFAK
jgi:catechol 2,3-dioxygenase-like lactoylglutathione lyase family enzyme